MRSNFVNSSNFSRSAVVVVFLYIMVLNPSGSGSTADTEGKIPAAAKSLYDNCHGHPSTYKNNRQGLSGKGSCGDMLHIGCILVGHLYRQNVLLPMIVLRREPGGGYADF